MEGQKKLDHTPDRTISYHATHQNGENQQMSPDPLFSVFTETSFPSAVFFFFKNFAHASSLTQRSACTILALLYTYMTQRPALKLRVSYVLASCS